MFTYFILQGHGYLQSSMLAIYVLKRVSFFFIRKLSFIYNSWGLLTAAPWWRNIVSEDGRSVEDLLNTVFHMEKTFPFTYSYIKQMRLYLRLSSKLSAANQLLEIWAIWSPERSTTFSASSIACPEKETLLRKMVIRTKKTGAFFVITQKIFRQIEATRVSCWSNLAQALRMDTAKNFQRLKAWK